MSSVTNRLNEDIFRFISGGVKTRPETARIICSVWQKPCPPARRRYKYGSFRRGVCKNSTFLLLVLMNFVTFAAVKN